MELTVESDEDDYWQMLIDDEEETYNERDTRYKEEKDIEKDKEIIKNHNLYTEIENTKQQQKDIEEHDNINDESEEWIEFNIKELELLFSGIKTTFKKIPHTKKKLNYTTYTTIEEQYCSICLGTFSKNSIFCKTKCNHHFCYKCTTEWFVKNSKNKCPYCNQKQNSI